MDRRKRKSQEAIRNSLLKLLEVKSIEKITINEIAELADVSRGTVYLNYVDKYSLLEECIDITVRNIFNNCMSPSGKEMEPSKDIIFDTFKYIEENSMTLRVLLTNVGFSTLREKLFEAIKFAISKGVEVKEGETLESKTVEIEFLSSGIMGVLIWWVINETNCTVEEISNQLWDYIMRSKLL